MDVKYPGRLSADHKLQEVFWARNSSSSQHKRHTFTRALSWEETPGSGS